MVLVYNGRGQLVKRSTFSYMRWEIFSGTFRRMILFPTVKQKYSPLFQGIQIDSNIGDRRRRCFYSLIVLFRCFRGLTV